MSMNQTPRSERTHIGFFGLRNAGKSSLLNAITGQSVAIVSDLKGTTTDPVFKSMELLPLGPVVVIDTPGLDDEGELGALRVERARQVLGRCDIALLVVDAQKGLSDPDRALLEEIRARGLRYLIAFNKCDLSPDGRADADEHRLYVSAQTGEGIYELKERIAHLSPNREEAPLLRDLLSPGDVVALVVPIDEAAPKGRLILPQQQAIRDILEAGAFAMAVRETGLRDCLNGLCKKPRLVVTDSQVFARVAADTPPDVELTSFSILLSRRKGNLAQSVRGVRALDALTPQSRVLICEGCTHHRQCGDIGTVKLPRWIEQYTGVHPAFEFTSGGDFPQALSPYSLIVHCGGCMLNEREVRRRAAEAERAGVPFTNYGILIARTQGILRRSLSPFPEYAALIER